MTDDYSGEIIGERYRLEALIGAGGMGSVYLGEHLGLGRKVAVKFLHTALIVDEVLVKRFSREAKTTSKIFHENIVDVMDSGVSSRGEPYLVMEYLEGENLATRFERTGPLSLEAAAAIIIPVLRALTAAHEQNVVHRDLKPDNIFILREPRADGSPAVKVIDFGIAKPIQDDDSKLTQVGQILGTPVYMSPEQVRGVLDLDQRSDLFSMGTILYEALTGSIPFGGETNQDVLMNILIQTPIPPAALYPDFPPEAGPFLDKALAKDRALRFQSASEMLEALARLVRRRQSAFGSLTELSFASTSTALPVVKSLPAPVRARALFTRWSKNPRVLGGAFATLIVVLALAVFLGRGEPPVTKATAAPSQVTITVEGLPPGAEIRYGGALISGSPFQVPREQSGVPMEIAAQGFEPEQVLVVPSEDRTLRIDLRPAVAPAEGLSGKRGSAEPAAKDLATEAQGTAKDAADTDEQGGSAAKKRRHSGVRNFFSRIKRDVNN